MRAVHVLILKHVIAVGDHAVEKFLIGENALLLQTKMKFSMWKQLKKSCVQRFDIVLELFDRNNYIKQLIEMQSKSDTSKHRTLPIRAMVR
jgi:hypothetical protein